MDSKILATKTLNLIHYKNEEISLNPLVLMAFYVREFNQKFLNVTQITSRFDNIKMCLILLVFIN